MTRLVWQFIGTLLLVGLMLKFWWVIALLVAAVILFKRAPGWWAAHEAAVLAEEERLAEIAARADLQHNWVMSGDERGLWGVAWPAMRKYEQEVKR
jgi:hypothetical protein